MANILDVIGSTIGSLFGWNRKPQQYQAAQQQPQYQPTRQMTPRQQLAALNPEFYNGKYLDAMDEEELQGRLRIEIQNQALRQQKQNESNASAIKFQAGQQEIERNFVMKEMEKQQTYNQIRNERDSQADVFSAQLRAKNQPFEQWMYQQEMNKNAPLPSIPIRFG